MRSLPRVHGLPLGGLPDFVTLDVAHASHGNQQLMKLDVVEILARRDAGKHFGNEMLVGCTLGSINEIHLVSDRVDLVVDRLPWIDLGRSGGDLSRTFELLVSVPEIDAD